MNDRKDFKNMYLSMTEFRKSFNRIIKSIKSPQVVMFHNKPKVVVLPYEQFKMMEETIEKYNDMLLSQLVEERSKDAKFVPIEEFFNEVFFELDE